MKIIDRMGINFMPTMATINIEYGNKYLVKQISRNGGSLNWEQKLDLVKTTTKEKRKTERAYRDNIAAAKEKEKINKFINQERLDRSNEANERYKRKMESSKITTRKMTKEDFDKFLNIKNEGVPSGLYKRDKWWNRGYWSAGNIDQAVRFMKKGWSNERIAKKFVVSVEKVERTRIVRGLQL